MEIVQYVVVLGNVNTVMKGYDMPEGMCIGGILLALIIVVILVYPCFMVSGDIAQEEEDTRGIRRS